MSTLLGDAKIRMRADWSVFEKDLTGETPAIKRQGTNAGNAHVDAFSKARDSALKKSQGKFNSVLHDGFKSAFAGLGAGFVGVGVIEMFKGFIDGARESARVGALTAQVIKSTGGAAGITASQVGDLATAISNKTGVDDEAIQSGENLLLTFTKVRNEAGKGNDIFNQATSIVTDMSVALGQDLSSSAIQVGKALNDPIRGVSALQRVGVTFNQQQKDQIKLMVQSGNVAGAQKIILKELATEFGGAAAAASTPMQKLLVHLDNIGEEIGGHLLPVIDNLAGAMEVVIGFITGLPTPVYALIGAFAAGTIAVKLFGSAMESVGNRGGVGKSFKAGLGSIVGMLGGPWGIAFAAGTSVLGYFLQKQQEGKQYISDLSDTLDKQTGAVTANTRTMVAQTLEQNGAIEKAKALGLNMGLITDAVTGNDAAMNSLKNTLVPLSKQMVFVRDANGQMTYQQSQGAKTASELLGIIENQTGAIKDAATKARDLASATASGNSTLNTNIHLSELQGQLTQKNADYNKNLTAALKKLNDSLQASNNQFLIMRGAENGVFAAMDDLTKSIKENGRTLDVHTAKGRANRTALDQVASAALNYLSAQTDNVKASPRFVGMMDQQRDRLITAAKKFGLSDKAAKDYAARILKVPTGLATKVTQPGMVKALQDIKNLKVQIEALKSKTLEVRIDSHGNALLHDPNVGGHAEGGYISGPGTGRSDSILAKLSNGEFVTNARATKMFRPLLEHINGFAGGGLVTRNITMNTRANMPRNLGSDIVKLIDPAVLMGMGGGSSFYQGGGGYGNGPGSPGGTGRWAGLVLQVLRMLGQSAGWLGTVLSRMNRESGGNPNAINLWDSNAKAGYPSRGLMQTIPGTFNAYAGPFRSRGIVDPLANIYAGLNYALHRYGSLAALNRPGGYANGTNNATAGWHWVGENGRELVNFKGGESVTPESKMGGVSVQVFIGERELTEIVDVRVTQNNNRMADALRRGRR